MVRGLTNEYLLPASSETFGSFTSLRNFIVVISVLVISEVAVVIVHLFPQFSGGLLTKPTYTLVKSDVGVSVY